MVLEFRTAGRLYKYASRHSVGCNDAMVTEGLGQRGHLSSMVKGVVESIRAAIGHDQPI